METNQSASQDSSSVIIAEPKKTFFSPKKILLLLLAVGLIIAVLTLGQRFLIKQKFAPQQPGSADSKAAITTIHIPKKGPAVFVKTESIPTLPLITFTEKPLTRKNSYIFQVELISKDQQPLYKSWKQSPIIRTTDGGFDIKALTPYQPDSILKISNEENKLIILTSLR